MFVWVACGEQGGCAVYDAHAVLLLAAILALPIVRLAVLVNECLAG